MRKLIRTTVALVVAIAASTVIVMAPAPPAHALVGCAPEFDVQQSAPGVEEYRFRRCGVPDFDQLRTILVNGGQMYCAPTSAADWMVYLAERGAFSVMPGPGHAENYGRITTLISDMGNAMGTHPSGGTLRDHAVDGLIDWFDRSYGGRGGDYFAVRSDFGGIESADLGDIVIARPTGRALAAAAANGSLVMPVVGWYQHNGRYYERTGGHVVTLASARPAQHPEGDPGDYLLGFGDPGSDEGDPDRQSAWTTDPHLSGAVPGPIPTGEVRERMDKLFGDAYSSGWLEGMISITPKFGLFPDPEGRMTLRRAVDIDDLGDRVIGPLDGRVLDIALGWDGVSATALLEDGRLVAIRNLDARSTEISTEIPNATSIALDEHGRTAAIDADGRITLLDRHHNPVTSVLVPGATGLGFSQRLRAFVTFDAAHQELVVVEAIPGNPVRTRRLAIKPEGPPIAPDAALTVNPSTGIIGLLEPDTSRLTRAIVSERRFTTVDSITLGDGAPLHGLVADATGAWYATRDGRIVAFDVDGTELVDNPFAGQLSAPTFELFQPMSIGTAPEGPDVLPHDAPQVGDQLTLTQAASTEPIGVAHHVALVLADAAGTPLAGRPIGYAVTGTNAHAGTSTTDASGGADISWTSDTPGGDQLTAWEDINGNGSHDIDEAAASTEMSWAEDATIQTRTSLASSANPSRPGRRVTFTATVSAPGSSGTPRGTVDFTNDGTSLGPPVPVDPDGTATLTTRSLTTGRHQIEATFTPADASTLHPSTGHLDQLVGTFDSTGNLIRNPGADQGAGSASGGGVPVPEWSVDSGGFTAVEYGAVDPATGLPFPTASQGPADGQQNFFAGGPNNASAVAVQIIPLPSGILASVDAGAATYRFSAWLGGYEDQNDLCEPVLLFTTNADGTGVLVGRDFLIGGQAADRNNETRFLPYETLGAVPPGARSAHVVLQMSRTHGFYNDGYCDSLALTISTPR